MMFPLAETLVYLTKGMTLEPGDILLTGTPSGVGHARKPEPVWMKPGDVCEIEIEGIGVLRNPIEDERVVIRHIGTPLRGKTGIQMASSFGTAAWIWELVRQQSISVFVPSPACGGSGLRHGHIFQVRVHNARNP